MNIKKILQGLVALALLSLGKVAEPNHHTE